MDRRKSTPARHKPKYKRGTRILDIAIPKPYREQFPNGRLGTLRGFLVLGKNGEEWYSVQWDQALGDSSQMSFGSIKESFFRIYEGQELTKLEYEDTRVPAMVGNESTDSTTD